MGKQSRLPAGLSTPLNTFFFFVPAINFYCEKESFKRMAVGLKQNSNESLFSTRYLFGTYG